MSQLQITHSARISAGAAGSIIKAEHWALKGVVDDAAERLQRLVQQAETDAAKLKRKAYDDGFAEGLAAAQRSMTMRLAQTEEQAFALLAAQEDAALDMAFAVVQRLLGAAPDGEILRRLVREAIANAQAERYVRVRVHPSQEAADATGAGFPACPASVCRSVVGGDRCAAWTGRVRG